jgi:hypothetical protein
MQTYVEEGDVVGTLREDVDQLLDFVMWLEAHPSGVKISKASIITEDSTPGNMES